MNSDGIPDLLSAGGDGTFNTILQNHSGSCIYADFEKTNKLSAACVDGVNTLTFFHINSDGSFNLTNPLGSVVFAGSFQFTGVLQALDLNGDGTLDIVLNSNDGLQVAIGKPGLTFSTPVPYAAGTTTATNYVSGAFSDLDGDGHPDFVLSVHLS